MTANRYLLANAAIHAGDRFAALSAMFDPVTFAHVDALGIGPGWRCWEVGAGGISVPRWMAGKVGPTGRVLATDIDVSWLDDADAGVDVRRHDVATDDPPGDAFDLVHARLVLVHVAARDEALRRMISAVRPGGWMVVEDFDTALVPASCLEAPTVDQQRANRIRHGFYRLLAGRGVDLEYGRKLPRLLRDGGLEAVAADAYFAVAQPASRLLETANTAQVATALVDGGWATRLEIDDHLAALERGALDIATPPLISAWGRRRP
jgi:SAM-dependent methyltransferase